MSELLKVSFAGIEFENPITTASGTFGSGMEYSEFTDIARLGAVTTKGVADHPWEGNPTPRVAETPSGMLNAIGLQNPGVKTFINRDLPFLKEMGAKVIVNVCGHSEEEYVNVVKRLAKDDVRDDIALLEINISCPNVKEGGIAFGQKPEMAEAITKAVKREAAQPVVMKLSPNVTDITEMAKAVEAGGADGISLINTITGMKIDINRKKILLANQTGGLSGPAIHPVAVRMVYQVSHAVELPIIGMGGVQSVDDALELMMAGATMVAVGTANFYHPTITTEIIDGMERYVTENGLDSINDIIGCV
ncbi:MAG: dihydroorotate dehydrogenase [Eubacterium sp.]|nr:dihydroorotate dehydrogenase [Eubacterium sp.]